MTGTNPIEQSFKFCKFSDAIALERKEWKNQKSINNTFFDSGNEQLIVEIPKDGDDDYIFFNILLRQECPENEQVIFRFRKSLKFH